MHKIWTIQDISKEMATYFGKLNFDNPRLDVELLLADILKVDRLWLYLHPDQPLTSQELADFKKSVIRRYHREPIQYIIGHWGFWTVDLKVTSEVLIPRPETETLIEAVLRLEQKPARIIDLGTGSGNIVIALAKEIKEARFWATDISQEALKVARKNALRLNVSDNIDFLWGDLFDPFEGILSPECIDLIVTNPPYISSAELERLQPEISRFEPRVALDGGEDGLDFYGRIIHNSARFLRSGGHLIMEFGQDQSEPIIKMIKQEDNYTQWELIKDYNKRERVIAIRKGDSGFGKNLHFRG